MKKFTQFLLCAFLLTAVMPQAKAVDPGNDPEFNWNCTVSPESGTVFANFMIDFNYSYKVAFTEDYACTLLIGEKEVTKIAKEDWFVSFNSLVYSPEERPKLEPGVYTISFAAGALQLTEDEVSAVNPEAVTAEYTVLESASYNMIPESGSILKELSTVELEFSKDVKVEEGATVEVYVNNEPDAELKGLLSVRDGNVLVVTFDPPVTKPGKYELVGLEYQFDFTDGTFYEEPIPAIFNVDEGSTPPPMGEVAQPAVEPAEGEVKADELVTIKLTFEEGVEVNSINGALLGALTICHLVEKEGSDGEMVEERGDIVDRYTATIDENQKNVVVLEAANGLSNLTESGRYTLVVPPTLFDTNQGVNLSWAYTWDVTVTEGVATMAVETAKNGNVYNASGICVLRNADKVQVSNLPKGLYIFNGKKIIVK